MEYTLKQAIDKFERNPNLRFKFVAEESYRTDTGAVISLDEEGRIVNQEGEPILSNFSIRSRFQLVGKPVERIEAFKAFQNGKPIYCDYMGKRYIYSAGIDSCMKLMDDNSTPVSVEQILHGEWFIKEAI